MQLAQDLGAAGRKARDHGTLVVELALVVIGVLQHQGIHARLEAVAVRLPPRLQAESAHGHHLGAVQRDEAVSGPDEVDAAPAIGELVLHHLRDRQRGERGIERRLQAAGERRSGLHRVEEERFGLAIAPALQRRHGGGVRAERGELLEQRRRRLAVGAEADRRRHQLVRHRLVGGPRDDAGQVQRQPARRRERRHDGSLVGQALRPQARGQAGSEGLAELVQRLRRQLFDEQFDEQILRAFAHGQAACFCSRCASSRARTSSAQAFGAIGKPRRARLSR